MTNMDDRMTQAAQWLADANGVTLDQAKADLAEHGGFSDWSALVKAASAANHGGRWQPPVPKPLVQPRMTEAEAQVLAAFRVEKTMDTISAWMEAFAAMMARAQADKDELDRIWPRADHQERRAILERMARTLAATPDRLLAGRRGSGRIELPLPDLGDLLSTMPDDVPPNRMN